MKNLGGFKREILRCAQNDKNSLLIAHWYKNQPFMGLRPTQDHETGGTGFPSCAWTPEGGCPTLSEQINKFRQAVPLHRCVFLPPDSRPFPAPPETISGPDQVGRRPASLGPRAQLGALTGCATPGQEILLTQAPPRDENPLHLAVRQGPEGWICIDTLAPNRVVADALAGRGLRGFPNPGGCRRSHPPAGEPAGFCPGVGGKLAFLEIKSVTWVEDGVALFRTA